MTVMMRTPSPLVFTVALAVILGLGGCVTHTPDNPSPVGRASGFTPGAPHLFKPGDKLDKDMRRYSRLDVLAVLPDRS